MTMNFSPVTEDEVNDFMKRVATTIVGYSSQAEELAKVQLTLNLTSEALDNLRTEHRKAQSEARDNHELATTYERERDQSRRDLDASKAAAQALQDAMIGRDATVSELRQKLASVTEQAETFNTEVNRLNASNASLKDQVNHWRGQAEAYLADYGRTAKELEASEASLKSIREAHEKVFAAFKPPQSDPVPAQPEENSVTVFVEPPAQAHALGSVEGWKPSVEMKPVQPEEGPKQEMPDWLKPAGAPSREKFDPNQF